MSLLYDLLLIVPPMLLSLTVHEYAHARTALAFGDPTAASLGRVSLNPLRHLDLVGTIVFLVTRMVGWAKPVPVNPYNLHPRRLGDALVSAAGPLSNLALAIITLALLAGLLRAQGLYESEFFQPLFLMLLTTVSMNIGLFVFNLTPLYPLDGHHILREFLPVRMHEGYMHWQMRYGVAALLIVWVVPGLVKQHIDPNFMGPVELIHSYLINTALRLSGISFRLQIAGG